MPVHERQSEYANTQPKRGLNGRAAGPVNAAGTAPDEPYALGNVHAGGVATGASQRISGRPAGLIVSSPVAGTVRVAFTAETGTNKPTTYSIYIDDEVLAEDITVGTQADYPGVDPGTYDVTVRGVDEDGNEFTESAATEVIVA